MEEFLKLVAINGIIPSLIGIGAFFIVSAYMKRKGENRADIEDVPTLTKAIEEVKLEFTEKAEQIKDELTQKTENLKSELELLGRLKYGFNADLKESIINTGAALWQLLIDYRDPNHGEIDLTSNEHIEKRKFHLKTRIVNLSNEINKFRILSDREDLVDKMNVFFTKVLKDYSLIVHRTLAENQNLNRRLQQGETSSNPFVSEIEMERLRINTDYYTKLKEVKEDYNVFMQDINKELRQYLIEIMKNPV